MGQETTMLLFYEKKEHFADLVNGWIFGGAARISPESLRKEDRRSVRRSRPGDTIHNRYRDIVHRVEQARIRVVIGTELQSYVDYLAPVRSMDYDVASYNEQIRALESHHRKAKDLREDEFLAGIGKDDRLIPTITLILYFGQREWDAAGNLHELLLWEQIPEEMRAYIGNYPAHVLDVYHMPDKRLLEFPGDMGYMFLYLKYQENKKELERMIEELPAFRHLDRDVYETLAEYTNTPELLEINEKQEGGDADIRNGLRELIEDGRAEGKEEGGVLKIISMVSRKYAKGKDAETIAVDLDEPLDEILSIYQLVRKYAPECDAEKIYEELIRTTAD